MTLAVDTVITNGKFVVMEGVFSAAVAISGKEIKKEQKQR